LKDYNLPLQENLIKNGNFHPPSGYQATRELLSQSVRPDAIFACNDLMAIGTIRAAYEIGLSIPNDLSIIGYDNIELALFTQPALTTIAQPIQTIADRAVHLLLERMVLPLNPPKRETLSNQLLIRSSTRRL
jgi:LacI family transcriptional regulator